MIIESTWGEVRNGQRVITPLGYIVHVLPRIDGLPGVVGLRNDMGATRIVDMPPSAPVQVVVEQSDVAVATLAATFPGLEFIRRY